MKLSVDETFQKYGDRIFSAAFSVCQNQADADDVVQDTMIRYYSLNKDFENESHLKAWLLRVAINRAKGIASSFWRRTKVEWEDYMDELAFEEPEDSQLFEAVMRLPEKYRTAIHLFYYEDYAINVQYGDDGSVWVCYRSEKIEITDRFDEDGVCYVQLKTDNGPLYLTIEYERGFSYSSHSYIAPDFVKEPLIKATCTEIYSEVP